MEKEDPRELVMCLVLFSVLEEFLEKDSACLGLEPVFKKSVGLG